MHLDRYIVYYNEWQQYKEDRDENVLPFELWLIEQLDQKQAKEETYRSLLRDLWGQVSDVPIYSSEFAALLDEIECVLFPLESIGTDE